MKRDITFEDKPGASLGECMGSTRERLEELNAFVMPLVNGGKSPMEIAQALNERGDVTDGEWTAVIFALGMFAAMGLQKHPWPMQPPITEGNHIPVA